MPILRAPWYALRNTLLVLLEEAHASGAVTALGKEER
jgi:hypothetical protein